MRFVWISTNLNVALPFLVIQGSPIFAPQYGHGTWKNFSPLTEDGVTRWRYRFMAGLCSMDGKGEVAALPSTDCKLNASLSREPIIMTQNLAGLG